MSITHFLLARIAEDEKVARAALTGIHGEHKTSRDYAGYALSVERDSTMAQDEFIETFWPARMLAECAAKRAIMELHQSDGDIADVLTFCNGCGDSAPCPTIRTLAAVYAEHPEFRDEWKVTARL